MEKPKITYTELINKIITQHGNNVYPDFFITGIRGYYSKTMGKTPENELNIYDDAIILVDNKNKQVYTYNGNTDPSKYKLGIAKLKVGVYPVYKFDIHRSPTRSFWHLALCQRAGNVTVTRQGKPGEFKGSFGINIHKGGVNNTLSEGCQTVYMLQFQEFIDKAQELAKKVHGTGYKDKIYTYILIDK